MSHTGMTAKQAAKYKLSLEEPVHLDMINKWMSTLGLKNPLLNADSYKASHARQYPPGTEQVYSYIESRGGEFDKILFFGLQAYLKQYLSEPINPLQIEEAREFWAAHGLPFDAERWQHIVDKHEGFLPVEIRALPEGIKVAPRTVMLTITNTDPECFWLPSFLETALLRAIWYPTTVATISSACKDIIKTAFDRTSDDPAGLMFKLHDFGARGVSSQESAALGAMAHLVNFRGTDTVSGILAARELYGEPMAGFSIPAAEHSTITSWGRENETEAYRNMLTQFGDGPLIAIVSDSYDIGHAVSHIFGVELKQEILDSKATLVVRPDSGDPMTMPIEVIKRLDAKFGHTVNSKGYRVLHPKVRVIQGDGINFQSLRSIIWNLDIAGYSIDNLAFGMGGGLLQMCNRDTLKFAMKCSAVKVNGIWRNVCKEPKGQPDKASKQGRFQVIGGFAGKGYATILVDDEFIDSGELKVVWKDGKLMIDRTFSEIRERADEEAGPRV